MSEAHKGCVVVEDPATYELEVIKCLACEFNLGIDASYLVFSSVTINCPGCNSELFIPEVE